MEEAPEQLYECNWKRGCDCNWARLIHIVYAGLVSSPPTEALCKLEEVTGKEVGSAMSTLRLCVVRGERVGQPCAWTCRRGARSQSWRRERQRVRTRPTCAPPDKPKACCATWRTYSSHFFSMHIFRTHVAAPLAGQGKLPEATGVLLGRPLSV